MDEGLEEARLLCSVVSLRVVVQVFTSSLVHVNLLAAIRCTPFREGSSRLATHLSSTMVPQSGNLLLTFSRSALANPTANLPTTFSHILKP